MHQVELYLLRCVTVYEVHFFYSAEWLVPGMKLASDFRLRLRYPLKCVHMPSYYTLPYPISVYICALLIAIAQCHVSAISIEERSSE
jgi:hypothetical protein